MQFVQGLASDNPSDYKAAAPTKTKWDNTGVGALLTTDFGDVSLSVGADVEMTGDEDLEGTDRNESMDFDAGANATVTLTPNTSLKSNFLHSSKSGAATDVEVVLSDKGGLVDKLSWLLPGGCLTSSVAVT